MSGDELNYFTRHHLITHTKDNEIVDLIMHPDKTSQPFQPFLPCLGDDKETEVLPDELYRIKCDTKMNVQSTWQVTTNSMIRGIFEKLCLYYSEVNFIQLNVII